MTVGEYDVMCKQGILENPLTLEDQIVRYLTGTMCNLELVGDEEGPNRTLKISTELFKKVESA
jgi:hypothetical protein